MSGAVDEKIKNANAYADATRDDLEKVNYLFGFRINALLTKK